MADKLFTCSYPFRGARWCFDLRAEDAEEAEARLKSIAGWGRVDGEVVVRVGATGFWRRLRAAFSRG